MFLGKTLNADFLIQLLNGLKISKASTDVSFMKVYTAKKQQYAVLSGKKQVDTVLSVSPKLGLNNTVALRRYPLSKENN